MTPRKKLRAVWEPISAWSRLSFIAAVGDGNDEVTGPSAYLCQASCLFHRRNLAGCSEHHFVC